MVFLYLVLMFEADVCSVVFVGCNPVIRSLFLYKLFTLYLIFKGHIIRITVIMLLADWSPLTGQI